MLGMYNGRYAVLCHQSDRFAQRGLAIPHPTPTPTLAAAAAADPLPLLLLAGTNCALVLRGFIYTYLRLQMRRVRQLVLVQVRLTPAQQPPCWHDSKTSPKDVNRRFSEDGLANPLEFKTITVQGMSAVSQSW